MSFDCNCDGDQTLETIPFNVCTPTWVKDARFIFQVLDDDNNEFVTGVNGIEEETSWTALPDAANDTKVVITPELEKVNFTEPDDLDDSENFDGAPIVVGEGPQLVTAIIRTPSPAQYSALKNLACAKNLTVYRVDNRGKIMARKIGATGHAGIKISPRTFRAKSPSKGENLVDQEMMMIKFFLPDGWFGTRDILRPEEGFDPLEIKPS